MQSLACFFSFQTVYEDDTFEVKPLDFLPGESIMLLLFYRIILDRADVLFRNNRITVTDSIEFATIKLNSYSYLFNIIL